MPTLLDAVRAGATCAVIAVGFSAWKPPAALHGAAGKVTVIESHDGLCRVSSAACGRNLADWLTHIGIGLRTQASTAELIGNGPVSRRSFQGWRFDPGGPGNPRCRGAAKQPPRPARKSGVGQGVIVDITCTPPTEGFGAAIPRSTGAFCYGN